MKNIFIKLMVPASVIAFALLVYFLRAEKQETGPSFGCNGLAQPSVPSRTATADINEVQPMHGKPSSDQIGKIVPVRLDRPPDESRISAQMLECVNSHDSRFGSVVVGGKTIFEGNDGRVLTEYCISPNGRRVVVNTYSASHTKAFIFGVDGSKIADVPPYPDGMIAGEWKWLGDECLVGYYGPNELDEFENLRWTRFWIYNLKSREVSEIQLPDEIKDRRLIIRVLKTGEFELYYETDGKRIWFSLP